MIDQFSFLELLGFASTRKIDEVRTFGLKLAKDARESGDIHFADRIEAIVGEQDDALPPGLYVLEKKKTLNELNLQPQVSSTIASFLMEVRKAEKLKKFGVTPRHKALFVGPPGNGKTVLAGAVADALNIPSYMVHYDDLIVTDAANAGQTARNLLRLFDYAAKQPCLLFFDEFDALGRERDDPQESGEMKRAVSTLLVQLDHLPSHVVCIAATNHAKMLDSAIWRRFNIRLELPAPPLSAYPSFFIENFEGKGFKNIRFGFDRAAGEVDLEILTYRMSPQNFSDAELFVHNCVRSYALADEEIPMETIIWNQLDSWTSSQTRQVN